MFLGHIFFNKDNDILCVKNGKDQETSRNYVTWEMAEGTEDVYFGRRTRGIQTILNKFGVCVCKKYNILYQVS